MEKRFLYLFRRWWWVLVIAPLVTGGLAYMIVKDQPPIYLAETRLLIGPGIDTLDPDLNALRAGGQLMQTYAELSGTGPFLQEIIEELNLNLTAFELSRRIEVRSSPETQILRISVQHEDPVLAISIANVAAETLVGLSPTGSDSPTAVLRDQMRLQASKLEQIIADSQSTVEELEADLRGIANEEQQGLIVLQTDDYLEKQRLIIEQISQERARLSDALGALTLLYDSLQKTPTNQVEIVEPATMSIPLVSQLRVTILMAGLAGLVFAGAIVVALEYFDDTIKNVEDLIYATGLTVLGVLESGELSDGENSSPLIVYAKPDSGAAESYRLLGSKLISKYKVQDKPYIDQNATSETPQLKSLLIGSSLKGGNIGEIAANLAVVLSQTDRKVILVDANLQNPIMDQLFGVEQQEGLVDVIKDPAKDPLSGLYEWSPRLSILTSGSLLDSNDMGDPFGMLASERMAEVIETYEDHAAIVIIAASPFLTYADSFVLASRIDGVTVVAHDGETRRKSIKDVIDSLRSMDVHIIGSILDRSPSIGLKPSQSKGISEKINLHSLSPRLRDLVRNRISIPDLSFADQASVNKKIRNASLEGDELITGKRIEKEGAKSEVFPIQTAKG